MANKLPTCCQQSADNRPTNGQLSADCWQNILVKGGKQQWANCWQTVDQLLADSRPTDDQQSANSFLRALFFTFSVMCTIWTLTPLFHFISEALLKTFLCRMAKSGSKTDESTQKTGESGSHFHQGFKRGLCIV